MTGIIAIDPICDGVGCATDAVVLHENNKIIVTGVEVVAEFAGGAAAMGLCA